MKLLDYIRGLRKGKEAHRLEKESMKDPFLADAMDGYHQVEGDHDEQINKLRMKINAHSAKKKNTYAVTWSIAACLIIGIGISSYFLFLKQNVGEEVFIAKEQPAATATVPAHKEDTSLSAPKMEPDSGRPSATKETVGKDISNACRNSDNGRNGCSGRRAGRNSYHNGYRYFFPGYQQEKDESSSISHPNEQHDQRESDGRQRRTTHRS